MEKLENLIKEVQNLQEKLNPEELKQVKPILKDAQKLKKTIERDVLKRLDRAISAGEKGDVGFADILEQELAGDTLREIQSTMRNLAKRYLKIDWK